MLVSCIKQADMPVSFLFFISSSGSNSYLLQSCIERPRGLYCPAAGHGARTPAPQGAHRAPHRQGTSGLPWSHGILAFVFSHRHLTGSAPDDGADKWTGENLCCSSGRCAREPTGNQTRASTQHCGVDLWGGWRGQQVRKQFSQPCWTAFWQCCGTGDHAWTCIEKCPSRAQQQVGSACHQPQQKSTDAASVEILLPPAGITVCEPKAGQLIPRYPQPLLQWKLADEWTVLSPRPPPDSLWGTS